MAPAWFIAHTEEQWLVIAGRCATLTEVAQAAGNVRYRAFYYWVRANRPELFAAMRGALTTARRDAAKPRCSQEGCGIHVKARDMCRSHYEQWLHDAAPDQKIRRVVYPDPSDMVTTYERLGRSLSALARDIGVGRESLRDYLARRPGLARRLAPRPVLDRATTERRQRQASRRWRAENPDKVKAAKRRWAAGRSAEDVRRWNIYNLERRKRQTIPVCVAMQRLTGEYVDVILEDPCVYCGAPARTVDHVRPINTAGLDAWTNYAPACWSCNSSKRDKELLPFLLWRLEHDATGPRVRGLPYEGGGSNPVGVRPGRL